MFISGFCKYLINWSIEKSLSTPNSASLLKKCGVVFIATFVLEIQDFSQSERHSNDTKFSVHNISTITIIPLLYTCILRLALCFITNLCFRKHLTLYNLLSQTTNWLQHAIPHCLQKACPWNAFTAYFYQTQPIRSSTSGGFCLSGVL